MSDAAIPRYQAIADRIAERIQSGDYPAGGWLPGTAELATEFGVAPNTIQSAMRLVTRRGLVIRRHRVGTMVTRAPIARTIAVLQAADLMTREDSAYHRTILRQLMAQAEHQGLATRLACYERGQSTDGQIGDLAGAARAGELRGVIALGGISGELRSMLLAHADMPWIEPGAIVDYRELTRMGLGHLLAQGWRRPVVVGRLRTYNNQAAAEGAEQACTEAGLDLSVPFTATGAHTADEGLAAMQEHLEQHQPDAVLVLNDAATPGVLMALLHAGLVPGRDLGLATHANRGHPLFSPIVLTRVEVQIDGIATRMLDSLETVLSGKPYPSDQVLPMRLLPAASSCRG